MISVIARIELFDGHRAAFLVEFNKIVPHVRAEAGCIEYGPHYDIATDIVAQDPLRADTVVIIEKWESLPALKAHLNAPHMLEYRTKVKQMVASVRLEILQPA